QKCVACHAGGQFPELTPFGRLFKETGYTMGERTMPFSVMALAEYAKVASTLDAANGTPSETYAKNGAVTLPTASLFVAGKVTDHIGGFAQITYDNYANHNADGSWVGHTSADNIDIRYANRFDTDKTDLIYGVSLNNNPSLTDPWNTAPAWMQYVPVDSPGAYQFTDANTPYPTTASDSGVAGLTAYALWNSCVYAEFGLYRTANQIFSILNAGTPTADTTQLQGLNNPYWRLAYTKDWGSQNIMVGTSGMLADVYDGTTTPTDGNAYQHKKSIGLDMQYQYLGDPNVVSVQMAYMRNTVDDSVNGGGGPSIDTPRTFRSKLTYVYQNTYGGDVAYFNLTDEKDRTQEQLPGAVQPWAGTAGQFRLRA
ncbi:MAG TPA: cytochrome C, partial [Limnobacter sp.]|uniref:cytochrome C n=1 Tax=Limnobacter sp. TaxID=2003368 RepID=UPI002E302DB2